MSNQKLQYTDQELADLGIKLRVVTLDLNLIDKKKYRKPWKVIVYNIWRQFGIDYFEGKYKKKIGDPARFSWSIEVQEQFEKIFEKELKTLTEGKITLPFLMDFWPLTHKEIPDDLLKRGIEVFEDKESFLGWLKHPCIALGSVSPESILKQENGLQTVMNILGRIEYGVYS